MTAQDADAPQTLTPEAFDAIVGEIYRAAVGVTGWQQALDQVAAALNAWNVHLMGLDLSTGVMLFSHEGGSPPPQGTLDYIKEWHRVDPRADLVLSNPPGRWYHCHEHFDEDFVASSPFYRDFLIPYGMRYSSGARFDLPDGVCVVFSASRGVGKQPYNDAERVVLQRLGEHVRQAFALRVAVGAVHNTALAGHMVLRRLQYPVFVLDRQGAIVFRNEAAERLVSRGAVYVEGGRLRLRGKHEDAAFAAASKSAMVGAECSPGSRPAQSRQRLVRCHEGFDGSALIHLAAIPPAQAMGAFGSSAVTIATIFQARQCIRIDPFAVSQAYGLTPAEARVAVGIAENKTVKGLARQYHVEISTLRTQLHRVFEKIGVQRQSELAQVLSSNPVLCGGGVLEDGHSQEL